MASLRKSAMTFRLWLCAAAWCCALLGLVSPALAQVCAAPGVAGTLTVAAANTVVNTYYPGTVAGGTAGGTTIGYTSGSSRGAAAIAAGDLVLIIQMQDGTGATTTNSSAYSFPAAAAGRYEFARVVSLGTNVLNLSAGLLNAYVQNTATANNQTYQVIRVPQYSTLTISAGGSIVPSPWDGTTGGVVVLDVAGAFTNNGSINASYAGFRGNAGLSLTGAGAGTAALTVATMDYVRPDAYGAHGGKGEGTAGTPDRILNVFSAPGVLLTSGTTSANGTATNATTTAQSISTTAAYLTATSRSYNGGSRAAGAPGNAGGGGDDSDPAANDENSGGAGGGNSGAGGRGGNTWNTNIALGGFGGNTTTPLLANKLTLGGGGGSGSTNNDFNLDASGGAGGGLVFVKAGTVGGTGSLLANGQAGRSIPQANSGNCPNNGPSSCDGAGGGGAGGGIVVLASSGTVALAQVRGGQGGNINGTIHGPGGGGGGGFVIASTGITVTTNFPGGIAGLTNVNTTPSAYGAGAGGNGASAAVSNAGLPANAGGLPANCLPALTTTKRTSTPAATTIVSPPGTTTYSIVVANPAGEGDARGIRLYDPSLPGGSATVANPPLPTVVFSTVPSACTLGTRTASVDPANGATSTFTAGTFNLPGGCTLTYTFTVNVSSSLPNGTYNNSALAFFLDPTDSSGSRTVTTALPPAASGLTANTSFTTGGTVGGSNYDGNNAANTGDDIRVQRSANLQISKTDGLTNATAGGTTSYTVTVANQGPSDGSGTVLTDPAVSGLSCTAVTCSVVSGAASCPLAGSVTVPNLQGSGITLATFPAVSSLAFSLTCGVTATGQ
ncbi:MAG: hypothetical protein V4455_09795 [Pseudomonadota bacterium]